MTRTWITVGLSALAVVLISLVTVLVVSPSTLPTNTLATIEAFDESVPQRALAPAIAAIIGLFALWRVYSLENGDVDSSLSSATTAESTDVTTDSSLGTTDLTSTEVDVEEPIVGAELTTRFDQTVTALQSGSDVDTTPAVDPLREAFRDVERAHNHTETDVSERLRNGVWTDDRVAAAFLAPDRSVPVPLWRRIYAWLFPARSFERRYERTLRALETHVSTLVNGPGLKNENEVEQRPNSSPDESTADSGGSDASISRSDRPDPEATDA
jgi:hypothetical protein